MARKRFLTPSFKSTRGHSVATRWSSPSARFSDDTYVPYYHHRHFLDTSGEENAIRRNVNKELILTSNFIDDSYDMAAKSRNRDQEVLRDATRAIVDSETYHNPKAEVASRRARSQPPTMMHATQSVLRSSRASVPPPSTTPSRPYVRRSHREVVVVVKPHRNVETTTRPASLKTAGYTGKSVTAGGLYYPHAFYPVASFLPRRKFFVDAPRGVDTRLHSAHPIQGRSLLLPLFYRLYYPKLSYNPYTDVSVEPKAKTSTARVRVLASPLPYKKRFLRKAALVGSNVDVHVPHKKRPKSKYAASVIREINIKKHWEAGEGSPVESDIPTSHLHASPRPVAYRLIY